MIHVFIFTHLSIIILKCLWVDRRATDPLTWSYVEKVKKGVQGNSVSHYKDQF